MKLHILIPICLFSIALGYFARYSIEIKLTPQELCPVKPSQPFAEKRLPNSVPLDSTNKDILTLDEQNQVSSRFLKNSFWLSMSSKLSPEAIASIEAKMNQSLFNELLQTDLTYAAEIVENMDGNKRGIYIEALIETWKEKEPYAAYQWLLAKKANIPQDDFDVYYKSILLSLAKNNPEIGAQLIGSMDNQDTERDLIVGLAQGWARKDINKAFEWIESLSNHELSANVLDESYYTIMSAFAEIDPVAASQAVEKLESEELQVRLMQGIVDNLMATNLEHAITWTLNLNNENARDSGITHLLSRIGGRQPDKALNILINNQAKISAKAIDAAIWPAAEVTPEIVAEKLLYFQEENQTRVAESLISNWIRNDEKKAIQWLQQQPEGTVLEAAAAVAASYYLYNNNPGDALQWISKLQTPQKRAELLAKIIDYTDSANLEALALNMQFVKFPPQQQVQLEEKLDRRLRNANAPLIIP